MELPEKWHGPARYQIKVKGLLGNQWSNWFEGMKIESEDSWTTITGDVSDQSALHGLIVKIRDMGLPLISIKRFQKDQNNKK